VKRGLTIIPVSTVDEVLDKALDRKLVPIEWSEPEPVSAPGKGKGEDDVGELVTH